VTAAPMLSAALTDVVARAVAGHGGGWAPLAGALRALDRLAGSPAEADLGAWATRIHDADGAVPLPGTGLRAAAHPGLLWAGERCSRAGLGAPAQLALVGLVVGAEHARSAADLSRALQAGLAVADALDERIAAAARPAALPTAGVVPAAACAAVLAGVPLSDLAAVLDVAGSLMAVMPPDATAGAWPGHSCAAGLLAVRAWSSGLTGMPDGLGHTVATVTGPGGADELRGLPPDEVPVGALLERLR
jgi:hypothetical protein